MGIVKRRYLIGVLAGALAIVVAAVGTAFATNMDQENVTGPEADAAVEAALVITGGGTANEVELDSEDGAVWEVEVTRPDGVTVDGDYGLVVVEVDEEEEGDDDD
ncbi:MAG: hypothetical protein HOL45_04625 [Chloroflexi bacterium]|nr:hypothetical protein [Chloroflexota bacterium]MBT6682105.1 hypothetical protein [Chloroflexota bacterium]